MREASTASSRAERAATVLAARYCGACPYRRITRISISAVPNVQCFREFPPDKRAKTKGVWWSHVGGTIYLVTHARPPPPSTVSVGHTAGVHRARLPTPVYLTFSYRNRSRSGDPAIRNGVWSPATATAVTHPEGCHPSSLGEDDSALHLSIQSLRRAKDSIEQLLLSALGSPVLAWLQDRIHGRRTQTIDAALEGKCPISRWTGESRAEKAA